MLKSYAKNESYCNSRYRWKVVAGTPYSKVVDIDESQSFSYEEANDGDTSTFSAIPADQLATIKVLLVKPDQQVNIRLDGASDAGILLSAGGFLAIVDATIDAGAGSSNAKVNNNSGSTALLKGAAGGT